MIESKQLSELTLLPPKDSRELAHLLIQEGLLQTQEIPKNSEHFPSETFFLYTVRPAEVVQEVGNRITHTLLVSRELRRARNRLASSRIAATAVEGSLAEMLLLFCIE